jgi:riboflavin synthase
MFTGIVTDIGRIRRIEESDGGRHIEIGTSYDPSTIDIGASIACSGCCLTVTGLGQFSFNVYASAETLGKTTIRTWREGRPINLERALTMGAELGGHLVTGHVDGVGEVVPYIHKSSGWDGESRRLAIRAPAPLHRFIAKKGSITVDGVSLTVNEVDAAVFGVNIIPHTFDITTLRDLHDGDKVNLEIDVLARYAARWQETA